MRGVYTHKKLTNGMGINDADYVVCKNEFYIDEYGNKRQRCLWHCPIHIIWVKMLDRFTEKWIKKHPTYKDVRICDDWLYFSKFKAWVDTQDWKGKQLDKDLLSKDIKIYSPETCIFIPQSLNKFLIDVERKGGTPDLPTGAYLSKSGKRFMSKVSNPFDNCVDYLGYFTTAKEAHNAWRKRKFEIAMMWVKEINDERVTEALINKYQY